MHGLPGDQIPSQQPPGRSLEKAGSCKSTESGTLLAGHTACQILRATVMQAIFPDSSALCDFPVSQLICKVNMFLTVK